MCPLFLIFYFDFIPFVFYGCKAMEPVRIKPKIKKEMLFVPVYSGMSWLAFLRRKKKLKGV